MSAWSKIDDRLVAFGWEILLSRRRQDGAVR